jgi:hypothetical protein
LNHSSDIAKNICILREDIHVHIKFSDAFKVLTNPEYFEHFLAPQFENVQGNVDGFSSSLRLPMKREILTMSRGGGDPDTINYQGELGSGCALLAWKISPETDTEVHVTAELRYAVSPGIISKLTESTIFKAYRLQSIRDSLWLLKQYLENFENDNA